MKHGCELIRRHSRTILLVALVGTVGGGYLTSQLGLESDLAELLPDDFDSVKALDAVREEVGGVGVLRVVLESSDFPAVLRLAADLEPRLESSDFVRDVEYRNDVEFYRTHGLLFLDTPQLDSLRTAIEDEIEAAKQDLNPFVVDDLFGEEADSGDDLDEWEARYRDLLPKPYYTNADSTVLVLQVFPARGDANLAYSQEMRGDVMRIIGETSPEILAPGITIQYGGNIQNRIVEYETIKSDIFGTALYGITAVFVVIALYFRSIVAAVLIAGSMIGALTWTFGLTALAIGQLNTITGFLFVILFGLGIDYGIHAFARYRESRRTGASVDQALHRMVCDTGAALTTTALTTSAAFFSLMLMDFRGFSELGFIAGIGLLFSLVAMVAVLPSLILVAAKLGLLRFKDDLPDAGAEEYRRLRYVRGTLIGTGMLSLVAIYGATHLSFEYDFTDLRVMTRERQEVGDKTRGVFSLSESPAIVLADSREDMQEIVDVVRRQAARDTLSPTVDAVRSVLDIVPSNQLERLDRIRGIRELVDSEADDVPEGEARRRLDELRTYLAVDATFGIDDLPETERRRFINKRGEVGNFVLIYPSVPLRDGRNGILFREDVGSITLASGKTYHAASSNIIFAEMLEMLTREGRIALLLSLGVVFIIVAIQFKSVASATLVMSPLVIGLLGTGGAMWALGMKLNMFNIVVLPTIVGIGVDSGVHIFHRYREEGPRSLPLVMRRTGTAIGMATLTTIVGFSGLLVATHPGLVSIGKLAVLGLAVTLVSACVFLPALLQALEDRTPTEAPEGASTQHTFMHGEAE